MNDILTSDIQAGVAQVAAGEFASPGEVAEINKLMDQSMVMNHFDSMDFRDALLITFVAATTGSTDGMEQAYSKLSDEQEGIVNEFISDFNQLTYTDERRKQVLDAVSDHIENGQLGKALKIVRSNDSAYPSLDSLTLRERIWTEVAKFDKRFEPVVEAYRQKLIEVQEQ